MRIDWQESTFLENWFGQLSGNFMAFERCQMSRVKYYPNPDKVLPLIHLVINLVMALFVSGDSSATDYMVFVQEQM